MIAANKIKSDWEIATKYASFDTCVSTNVAAMLKKYN